MKYQIHLSECDVAKLEHQVASALEKMVEQQSRMAVPTVWKITDQLNAMPKANEDVLKRRKARRKVYGIILIALGVFLFVPSVMDWKNMIFPLVSSMCAIGLGVANVIPHKNQQAKFLNSARKVLAEKPPYEDITFRNDDILLGSAVAIPYSSIGNLLETEHTYIVVFEKGMALIQKADVPQVRDESQEDFAQFVARQSGKTWLK